MKEFIMEIVLKTKICTKCQFEKPIIDFYEDQTKKDRLTCWCGSCMRSVNNKELAKLKAEVLTHYSRDKLACVRCGFKDIRALTIDHINGGGYRQRKKLGLSGNTFYRWLRWNNYPEGYQTMCMNCQFIKRAESTGEQN